MNTYIVRESPRSKQDAKRYIGYLRNVKMSEQAAQALYNDFRATKKELSKVAGIIQEHPNPKVRQRGLKRINFLKHNYYFLFRIVVNVVEIAAMFHGSEDYEKKLPL